MGVAYMLVNETKKEIVSFSHLNGSKKREIAGNAAQASITAWYLLNNQGDQIQFVSDTYDDWPFAAGTREGLCAYPDVTDRLVQELIGEGILQDNGMLHVDSEEPETIYTRDIVNVWWKRT